MAAGKALDGEPYAGNPHMWIDEGEVAPTATPRRGSLLYKKQTIARSVTALNIVAAIIAATFSSFASPHDGWREAKVAFLGDSITDARHVGCTSNYWNFLERDLGIVPLVYGKNGHQWKNLTGQAEKLKAEHPDGLAAIFVFAGTNDYNADVPLGEWWRFGEETVDRGGKGVMKVRRRAPVFDEKTFRGRINSVISYLKDNWPGTPIYLMTPLHRGFATFGPKNVQPDESHANGKGLFIDEYVAAVKEAGNIWAVNVIDLNAESGLFPMSKSHARFFHNEERDMLHPNNAGHEQIAHAIMRRIASAPLLTNH